MVLAVMAAAGCLQEGRPVDGRQLFAARDVEKPAFIGIDRVPYVMFHVRKTPAMPPRSATYELWLANYETGETRRLLENVADRDVWRIQVDMSGVRYVMVDERSVAAGSSMGVQTPVGTLVRLDLVRGELERIPDVSSYTVISGTNQFFYRTVTAGSRLPELFYRTAEAVTRPMGPSAGAAHVVAPGRMYFVTGEDRVLNRITAADAPVETIRTKVSRFMLNDDESWVVLQTADMGKSVTLAQQIGTGVERKLPGTNPCCWMGFSGNEFVYSESAAAGMPGKLHGFDVGTGADRVVSLPRGLADVSSVMARPHSTQSLYGDSQGRLALAPSGDPAAGRLLDLRPMSPSFTEDGRHFLYIEPDPIVQGEGKLMAIDGDFTQPPRVLSPEGALVPQGGFFFIADGERRILVFWAHRGRNASDLYFGNHESGEHRVVADGISEVTVTPRRVFGILRVSEQDLTGELVNKDLNLDHETVLAHSVADATVWGARVAFIIRERVPSKHDGLWAIPIDGVSNGNPTGPATPQ
jgi:hypothetical protein